MKSWQESIEELLARPPGERESARILASAEAESAYWRARDRGDSDAIASAIDVVMATRAVFTAHTYATCRQAPTLPWRELFTLPRVPPASYVHDDPMWRLIEQTDTWEVEELDALVDTLSRERHEQLLEALAEALLRRDLTDLAVRCLVGIPDVYAYLRVAKPIVEELDETTRRQVARGAWQRANTTTRLDIYGPSYITSNWLEALLLWPSGDAEATRRLRRVEQQIALLTPHQLEGSQDYSDIRLLTALAWAHHEDIERAMRWYRELGDDRHHWADDFAASLPDEKGAPIREEALLYALAQHARESPAKEDAYLPFAMFDHLTHLDAEAIARLWTSAEQLFSDAPITRARARLQFIPHLPKERAHGVWQAQWEDFSERATGYPEELDLLFEDLLDALQHVPKEYGQVLPWVVAWPRLDALEYIDESWPRDNLDDVLEALLGRADISPDSRGAKLIEDILEKLPELRAKLPETWKAHFENQASPSTPYWLWCKQGAIASILEARTPAEQRRGAEIYAEVVTRWSPQEHEAFIESLHPGSLAASTTTPGTTAARPHKAVRGWLEDALGENNMKAVAGLFPCFTSAQDVEWLTLHLLEHAEPLARWCKSKALRQNPIIALEALAKALATPNTSARASEVCQETLDDFAIEILRSREGPHKHPMYRWARIWSKLPEDLIWRLWERLMFDEVSTAVMDATLVAMTVHLGGIERMRAPLVATMRAFGLDPNAALAR